MSALPPPTAPSLLDQLRLSLGDTDASRWRGRLLQERLMRNITTEQERILLYAREVLDRGIAQFTQQGLADGCQATLSTTKEALRRAKEVALLDWRADYRVLPNGSRRRIANVYRVTMPQSTPQVRPDLRRHRSVRHYATSLKPSCSADSNERMLAARWWQPAELCRPLHDAPATGRT